MDVNTEKNILEDITRKEYEHGFVTDVEQEFIPKGLNEDIIRLISSKKEEPLWLLDFRLEAFRKWQKMKMPHWAHLDIPEIDFQDIIYYAAPKKDSDRPKEIDPELAETFEKLGIPLHERAALAGVAVDAVFDSVSVKTTFRQTLADKGIIFCSFSEAVKEHPDLVRKYLATVVPSGDNFYAALNSAVFSDGSFCYIPKGVRCPMELSSYFRINAKGTGQFERTLIVADEGSYVSYMEGCTAPMRDENQLHAAVVEIIVEKDAEGRVWYGTRGKGVMVGDEQYSHHAGDPASLSSNQVYNLYKDSRGRMWVATLGGGLNLAIREDGVYRFRSFFLKEGENRVRAVCEDANGWMWMGTDKGVFVFRPEELLNNPDAYYNYTLENGDLYSNEIRSIVRDSRGCMWIAETGAGFSYCMPGEDYARLEFTHYGMTDGLVNNMVQDFVEDLRGDMWISTEYGISCFDREAGLFENYFFSTNVLGNIYTENCGIRLPDGRLAFGTNYGLNIINPGALAEEVGNESTVTFTDLKLDGVSVRPGDEHSPLESALPYVSEIKLPYYQNSFVIDFSTLDYVRQGIQKFIYRLEGYEKTWSKPSPLSFAAYKNLRPGTYRLRVKASNALGVWSGKESVLKITVKPPFWKTGWAYLAYALLAGGLLYVAFSIFSKMNALRNQIKVEEQLTEYKLVFFTNISHEFRTPLTLIQNALEKIHRAGKLPREIASSVSLMDKSTGRMLRLINQLLEFRKMQNNKLSLALEKADVMDFLRDIALSFNDIIESKQMIFRFLPSVGKYEMFIDRSMLDKIVYNLLSNAFKYTPSGGKILLSATVDEAGKAFVIRVSDTGVGIPKEKRDELFKRFAKSRFTGSSMGIGLHLTHELVSVLKGTIAYKENTEAGGGSVFVVTLPLDASVYEEKDFLIQDNVILREEEQAEKQQAEWLLKDKEEMQEAEIEAFEPLNHRKVLVIEDDTDVREFLKSELNKYFEVTAASDGKSGLKEAHEHDFDLIISDVMMPGYSGFELTRQLKNDFETSHIPIILLTALDANESHLEGIDSGADAYITKPFSMHLLLTRAFRLIEQRDRLRKKFSNDPSAKLSSALCTTDRDKQFTERLALIIEKNMQNPQLSIDDLAGMMGVGRSIFYRKVRGITGYSPNEYLRIIRMKKAADLLAQSDTVTIAEVAREVGVNDPFYFSRCFKEQFGMSPTAYQKNKGKDAENND